MRGQLRYLSDQTAFATITLDVAERGIPAAPPSDDGFGIADAWHAAVNGLETIAAGGFVALVTAGPVLLLLGGVLLGGRSSCAGAGSGARRFRDECSDSHAASLIPIQTGVNRT